MALRLRVGRKGYIILPKAIREAVGIREGDEVIVEIKDGIVLKPARRVSVEEVRNALRKHLDRIKRISDAVEPKPGELTRVYLEEEFTSTHF